MQSSSMEQFTPLAAELVLRVGEFSQLHIWSLTRFLNPAITTLQLINGGTIVSIPIFHQPIVLCSHLFWYSITTIVVVKATLTSYIIMASLVHNIGNPQTFTVDVTPTANYPLDIYILMDLSTSMQIYLDNLRDVTQHLGTYDYTWLYWYIATHM